MVKVNIEDVRCGMVAAEDVSGQNGALLAAQGVSFGEEHIRAMRAFGVRVVSILSDEPGDDADFDEEHAFRDAVTVHCRELLRPRFATLDLTSPFGQVVFEQAARRAANRTIEDNLDLETVGTGPTLSSLPPERSLFESGHVDPISLVSGNIELVTLPEVYMRLLEAINSEKSSPQEMAVIIGRDPSLTAKLLKIVNSPHYASRAPIDTISRAVSMVGQKELANLVLGLAACNAFSDVSPHLCDMRAFWRHAATCGVYASLLAAACPGTVPDRVFVGGLLHDIGQLLILRKLPAAAGRALLLSRIEGLPLHEAEQAVLGFDHTDVGRALLAGWHFPAGLTAMVADHHHPAATPEARETTLVHVADVLASAWDWPAFTNAPVPPLQQAAWDALGLDPALLADMAHTADDRISEIESIFFTGPASPNQ